MGLSGGAPGGSSTTSEMVRVTGSTRTTGDVPHLHAGSFEERATASSRSISAIGEAERTDTWHYQKQIVSVCLLSADTICAPYCLAMMRLTLPVLNVLRTVFTELAPLYVDFVVQTYVLSAKNISWALEYQAGHIAT